MIIDYRFVILVITLSFLISGAAYCNDEQTNADNDSLYIHPEVMDAHRGWEKAVAYPGLALYSPIKYSVLGFGKAVGWVDDTKIIDQVVDFLNSDDGRRGVIPTYNVRTGSGAKFYQKGLFGVSNDRNILELTATAGLHTEQLFMLEYDNFLSTNNSLNFNLGAQFQKLTSESFFGLGPNSIDANEWGYGVEEVNVDLEISGSPKLLDNTVLNLGYESTFPSEDVESEIPDLYSETDGFFRPQEKQNMMYVMLSRNILVQNRLGNPTRGTIYSIRASLYGDVGNPIHNDRPRPSPTASSTGDSIQEAGKFAWYELDLQQLISLKYDRVLAIRVAGEARRPLNDSYIPFYYLSELGNSESIRGFKRGRFRDRDKLLATFEYRYPVWRNWNERGMDLVLFADTGQVSNNIFKEAQISNFKTGVGFGYRLWNLKGLVSTLYVANSEDGWRIYFGLN